MKPALAILLALIPVQWSQAAVIAHWNFDEGPVDSVAAGANSILDSSGNNLHGTPVLTPTYRTTPSSLGLEFSGGNEAVFVADDAALALTQGLTLEAVIRFDGTPNITSIFNQIVLRGDDRGGLDPYYLAVALSGELFFHVEDALGNASNLVSPAPITQGVFLHVAGTLDDATGEQKLYVNGIEVASTTTTVRPFANLSPSFSPGLGIGNVQSGTFPQGFGGVIDEVRISDVGLAPSEFLEAGPSSAVPEPTSFTLAILGCCTLAASRRRRVLR